jgi:hypothetical protein
VSERLAGLIVPRALCVGFVLAFAACSAAGWLASSRNPYQHFVRFHQFLSAESLYHPTVSQLRALVTAAAPPGRIAVVVGGTSVMNGVGQDAEQLWTRRLEDRLGEPFRVLNLAFRAGLYNEGGALAAESLVKAGRPVILVADLWAGGSTALLGHFYAYMLWDAYYKDLLMDYRARERRWDEVARGLDPAARRRLQELRLAARLDSFLRFNDLWTTLGYRHVFTAWASLARGAPFRARRTFPDPESGNVPRAEPYPAAGQDFAMEQLRTAIAGPRRVAWRQAVRRDLEAALPPAVRERTLIVVAQPSPHYVDQLTRDERARLAGLVRQSIAVLEEAGYEAMEEGDGLTAADFADRIHLAPAGGVKLADRLAPRVRAMAERLGYVR